MWLSLDARRGLAGTREAKAAESLEPSEMRDQLVIRAEQPHYEQSVAQEQLKAQSQPQQLPAGKFRGRFLYGGGFTLRLYHNPELGFTIGLNGNIETFSTHDSGTDAQIIETQGSLILSRKYENFIPYGGLQGSYLDLDADGDTPVENYSANSSDSIGALVGSDYFVNPYVHFNFEIHIFDQESVYLGVGYTF